MTYTLVRSRKRKKTLSIQLRGDGTVLIRVPHRTAQRDVDLFFAEKQPWLRKQIARQQQRQAERRQTSFRAGESFLFLGEAYSLRIDEQFKHSESLIFTGNEFVLSRDALPGARALFLLWYQRRALEYVASRIAHFSPLLGLFPRSVAIGRARCRWGSCSSDDRLRFNWRIVMAPPTVVDYVVLHEMSHMKIRDHSRDYWRFMEGVMPGCGACRDWLTRNGHLLTL